MLKTAEAMPPAAFGNDGPPNNQETNSVWINSFIQYNIDCSNKHKNVISLIVLNTLLHRKLLQCGILNNTFVIYGFQHHFCWTYTSISRHHHDWKEVCLYFSDRIYWTLHQYCKRCFEDSPMFPHKVALCVMAHILVLC